MKKTKDMWVWREIATPDQRAAAIAEMERLIAEDNARIAGVRSGRRKKNKEARKSRKKNRRKR